jgi:hypothetical protein
VTAGNDLGGRSRTGFADLAMRRSFVHRLALGDGSTDGNTVWNRAPPGTRAPVKAQLTALYGRRRTLTGVLSRWRPLVLVEVLQSAQRISQRLDHSAGPRAVSSSLPLCMIQNPSKPGVTKSFGRISVASQDLGASAVENDEALMAVIPVGRARHTVSMSSRPARRPSKQVMLWTGGVLLLALLGFSFLIGMADDAMLHGGSAPIRRGFYWAAGVLLAISIVTLVVLLIAIALRRKGRGSLRARIGRE